MIKRIVVILLLLSISITYCVNVTATGGGGGIGGGGGGRSGHDSNGQELTQTNLWDWIKTHNVFYYVSEWWKDIANDNGEGNQIIINNYNTYINEVESELDTATLIDGGIRVYLPVETYIGKSSSGSGLNNFMVDWSTSTQNNIIAHLQYIYHTSNWYGAKWELGVYYPKFNGNYKYGYVLTKTGDVIFSDTYSNNNKFMNGLQGTVTVGGNSLGGEIVEFRIYNNYSPPEGTFSFVGYIDLKPSEPNWYTIYDIDITIDSRPTTINYPVIYDDGTNIRVVETKLVDEVSKFVHLPWLDVDIGFTSWTYDYEARLYSFEIPGDEYLTMEYTDEYINYIYNYSDGTYDEYKAYYATPADDDGDGGDDNGDDGSGGEKSFWEKLFETIFLGLIEGIVGLFTTLVEFVANLFNSALGAIVSAFSGLWGIISGFLSGIGSSLSSFFGMFSADGGIFDVPLNDGIPVEIPTDSTSAPLQIGTFLALLGGMIGALPSELIYIGTAVLGITILFGVFKIITR